jgi:hypothetical protein
VGALFGHAFEEALGISAQGFYAPYSTMVDTMVLD